MAAESTHDSKDDTSRSGPQEERVAAKPPPPRTLITEADRRFVHHIARCFTLNLPPTSMAVALAPAAEHVTSWDAVARIVDRHRMSSIAYEVLRPDAVRIACRVPGSTIGHLRDRYTESFVQAATEPPVLHRIVEELSLAGVPALTLKGPVLGSWLYGDPALREHEDLDLVVPETSAATCDEVLRNLGYRAVPTGPTLRLSDRELVESATYRGEPGTVSLDVSFDPLRLIWRPASGPATWFDRWWNRRRTVVAGTRWLPTLSPEDDFVFLTRHLQFHDYFRVNWFVDVVLLLRRLGDELDWEYVGRFAREHALHSGVYRALELIETGYGYRAPDDAWRQLRPGYAVRRLHRRIWPDAYVLPRDTYSLGGSPVTPAAISPRGSHPIAATLLLATQPNRRLNFAYLFRRYFPTREWLRHSYPNGHDRSSGYLALLRGHWSHLRDIRRRVVERDRMHRP